MVTHQISDMKTLAQGHKLGVLVSVSGGDKYGGGKYQHQGKDKHRVSTSA